MIRTWPTGWLEQADQQVQHEVLTTSIGFWLDDRLGTSHASAWENMQQVLLQMGLLAEPQNLSDAYTNAFLPGGAQ